MVSFLHLLTNIFPSQIENGDINGQSNKQIEINGYIKHKNTENYIIKFKATIGNLFQNTTSSL